MTKKAAAASVASMFAVAGCGSSGGGAVKATSVTTSATKSAPAAQVQVTEPSDGSTIRHTQISVRGTVAPVTAAVQILGQPAQVSNGVFDKTVPLHPGTNHIDVVASGSGMTPGTTSITVTRGARLVAAVPKQQQTTTQTQKQTTAPPSSVSVPSVVGERLDVAEADLGSAGLTYKELGGGAFGIIVKSNWKVCQSRPSPGSQVSPNSRVTLIVDRPENC